MTSEAGLPQMSGPEPWVWQELEPLLASAPGRAAVDVGAHCGEWTHTLADLFETVWAFEPQMDLAVQLAESTPRHVRVIPGALGGAKKVQTFTTYADTAHLSSVFFDGGIGTGRPTGSVTLPCLPLDAFNLADVGLIKVDVEGAELDVLIGANRTIMRCRPLLVVEVHVAGGGNALAWVMGAWGYAARPVMHPLHPVDSEDYLRHHWMIGTPQ